jgi:cytidylate kinase
MDQLSAARALISPVTLATGVPFDTLALQTSDHHVNPEDLRILIRAAIREVAEAGRAVIVAHAASITLAGVTGVLRVLITASRETRARRLAAAQGTGVAEAVAAVAASDRERRDYLQRFYNVAHEQATHYDVVINTDVLTREQAVEIALAATCSVP